MAIAASSSVTCVASSALPADASGFGCSGRHSVSSAACVSSLGDGRKLRISISTAIGKRRLHAAPRCVLMPERVLVDEDEDGVVVTMYGKAFKDFERPDSFGRYGIFGGKYVPETLMAALAKLEAAHRNIILSTKFEVPLAIRPLALHF